MCVCVCVCVRACVGPCAHSCVVGSVPFGATTAASFPGIDPEIGANSTYDECTLSWYMRAQAANLVSDADWTEVKTSLRITNIDERLTWNSSNKTPVSCREMAPYYQESASWRGTGHGDDPGRQSDNLTESGSSTTTALHLSCGHHDWLTSSGHARSLSVISRWYSARSLSIIKSWYSACFYQHVCLQCPHDVIDDDRTCHHPMKRRPIDHVQIPAARFGSAGHEDMEKRANSIKLTNSSVLCGREASMSSDADSVDANTNGHIAAAVSTTTITADQSSIAETDDTVQTADTTGGQSEATAETNASSSTCPALVNTTRKLTDIDLVQFNASTPDITRRQVLLVSSAGRKLSSLTKSDVDTKTTHEASVVNLRDVAKDSRSSVSNMNSSNLLCPASAASGEATVKEIDLPKHGKTKLTEVSKSLVRESMLKENSVNDSAEEGQSRTAETSSLDDREDGEKHLTLDEDDVTASVGHDIRDRYEQQLRSLEMKVMVLENQLLQSTVDHAADRTAGVQLEIYVTRLERDLTTLKQSFVELKADNAQLRQMNLELAAASTKDSTSRTTSDFDRRRNVDELTGIINDQSSVLVALRRRNLELAAASTKDSTSRTTSDVDQRRNVDELTDLINDQSSVLVALRDKCSGLERDNRLLVERVLNQSVMMNEVLLRVEALGREQTKHALQLMELDQRRADSCKSSATVPHDQHSSADHAEMFSDPAQAKTHDGDTAQG